MRLIDADVAMQNVLDEIRYKESLYTSTVYSIAKKAIDTAPTVDPESLRPTAHIRHGTYKETYDDAFCSRCNVLINNSENYDAIWYNHYKYCPHCGARFVSADE